MKKSSILCGIVGIIGLLLTGCTNSFDHMPDLTEEESALIAEYAAGILLKYDKNAGKLASDAEIAAADEREATLAANTAEFLAAQESKEENDQENASETASAEPASSGTSEIPFEGIAQFAGVSGFQIEYAGYMICDSYPPADSADMVFAMDATAGNKLLVLQFTAENTTAEDMELDMLSQNIRYRISVNGGEMKSALSTLLLDDLSSYKDVIPAGTSVVLVLTREVTEEEANEISTISLSLKNASENATTLLE